MTHNNGRMRLSAADNGNPCTQMHAKRRLECIAPHTELPKRQFAAGSCTAPDPSLSAFARCFQHIYMYQHILFTADKQQYLQGTTSCACEAASDLSMPPSLPFCFVHIMCCTSAEPLYLPPHRWGGIQQLRSEACMHYCTQSSKHACIHACTKDVSKKKQRMQRTPRQ